MRSFASEFQQELASGRFPYFLGKWDIAVYRLKLVAERHMGACKLNSNTYVAWFNVICDCIPGKSLANVQETLDARVRNTRIKKVNRDIYEKVSLEIEKIFESEKN